MSEEDIGQVLDNHLREFVELKGIVTSHIQACQESRRMFFTLFGAMLTVAISVFGYSVHVIDTLRDNQADYSRTMVLLQKRADDVNADVTNRITAVVQANTQREATTGDRINQIKIDMSEMRKEFKEEMNRLRR